VHFFELSPNCSLTTRTATFFYVSIFAVTLLIAGSFAALGLWPILPFAGLEMLALAWALAASVRHGRVREYIRIGERVVEIRTSDGNRDERHTFARPWARVELRRAPYRTWPSRLVVGTRGRSVEVGAFLTETERRRLQLRLMELIPARDRN
jgi:uncharacterized membrane protein